MELPDVNVLIYAHREDAPEHDKYAAWLASLAVGAAPFALSSVTLGGFLRIVTNPRIFQPATPMELALAFCRQLMARLTPLLSSRELVTGRSWSTSSSVRTCVARW